MNRKLPLFSLRKYCLLLCLSLLSMAARAQTDYYVSNSGNDGNTGLTLASAKQTIQNAINTAAAGDIIHVSDGLYQESVTVSKSLTIQGESTTGTVVDGATLPSPVSGFFIPTGVTDVTIRDLTVQNFKANSPGAYAGIHADGSNHNLTIRNTIIKDNAGGSGIYANGPVNNVLIDGNKVSGHTNIAGAARGIVIWNGLKTNITITNNEVFDNNCCGIELQDGSASGVTLSGNNVHDNGDNGIGLVGLQGPGANLVSSNTLLNNGRFGIEIKNPNGSGATAGSGSVVIDGNSVARSTAIGDDRDIAGIAVFRRGVLPGNPDVPQGTVVRNNTVTGYTQSSTSEGFGIVVEGINHTVTTNNLNGNDVGIQRQAGHTPYPGDGDQNNVPDNYFGRGNSLITCGVALTGNVFSGNAVNMRDEGNSGGAGIVTNTNTGKSYCSIQAAVNDPATLSGHTLTASAGIYIESVVLNKSITLQGAGNTTVITAPTACSGDGITVGAGNATVKNLKVTGFKNGVNVQASNVELNGVESIANCATGIELGNGISFLTVKNSKINNNFSGGSGIGIRAGTGAQMSDITIDNCEVKGNIQGTFIAAASSGNLFNNISIKNSDFSNNTQKGMYFEKLSNAVIENVTMNNSGTDPAYAFNAGIDINLKFGTYSNITIRNSIFTGCGANGGGAHPESPVVLTIKARNDAPSYNGNPATLANVSLLNNVISGPQNGIRFGEFAKVNSTPTNVQVHENDLSGPFAYKKIINNTPITTNATCNWYGSTNGAAIASGMQGSVSYSPYLSNGTDNSPATGFQPVPNSCSGCPSGNVVQNTTTMKYYCSIQDAINDPATLAGHTITASAGTYTENITISKGIKLEGANANTACGSRGAESVIAGTGGNNTATVTITADGVTVNGFTVTNANGTYGIRNNGKSTINIVYNVVTNVGDNTTGSGASFGVYDQMPAGAGLNASNVNVSYNCISDIRGGQNAANSGNGSGNGIGFGDSQTKSDLTGITVNGNIITNISASAGATGGKGAYGIIINMGSSSAGTGKAISPQVTNNEISNLSGRWAHGVGLEGETPGAVVQYNTMSNFTISSASDAAGVQVEDNDGAASVQIHENSFTNMKYGVANVTTATVNATCNWYGTASSALVPGKVSGNVTYTPWLTDGTDASTATGFQPVNGSCNGNASSLSITCPAAQTFCQVSNNQYTVPPLQVNGTFSCGGGTIGYMISGATSRSGSGTDASGTFGLGTSTITWTATDNCNNTSSCQTSVTVLTQLAGSITMSPNPTVAGQQSNTVFLGYGPQTITLSANVPGATSWSWSSTPAGSYPATASISVTPTMTTTYTVTASAPNSCSVTKTFTVDVVDARCGNNNSKVTVAHMSGGSCNEICVAANAVPAHLAHGDKLGPCPPARGVAGGSADVGRISVYPNPSTGIFIVELPLVRESAVITVTDIQGKVLASQTLPAGKAPVATFDLSTYAAGIYLIRVTDAGQTYHAKLVRE